MCNSAVTELANKYEIYFLESVEALKVKKINELENGENEM